MVISAPLPMLKTSPMAFGSCHQGHHRRDDVPNPREAARLRAVAVHGDRFAPRARA